MRIIRTTFLLGALTLFLMMVGQYVGGRNGMTLGLGIAICTNAFAYFFSDKIALLSSGARPVSREQLPRLYAVMERLAAKANLPQRIPTTSLPPSTSALCIVKPMFGGAISSLFSTHPPLEKRIQALRQMTVTPQR